VNLSQLLVSTTKGDVMEAIEFFTIASHFNIEGTEEGIKKMVHLIWTKDDGSEEGRGIKQCLFQAYTDLYFTADPALSKADKAKHVVKNLFSLTESVTLAELTSLDELMKCMMEKGLVSTDILNTLWIYYGTTKADIPMAERRGAIMLLGMLGRSNADIVRDKLDMLLKVGLGPLGRQDPVLAKFSCIALQGLFDRKAAKKGPHQRFPIDHALSTGLTSLLLDDQLRSTADWFSVAEQAVNCLFFLCEQPDVLSGKVIKSMAAKIFGLRPQGGAVAESGVSSLALSQLLFVIGHAAIQQISHLEIVESHWKRQKTEQEKVKPAATKGSKKDKEKEKEDDLEQCNPGTTAEDEFAETVQHVRESELLYSHHSLFGLFAPLIIQICSSNRVFENKILQTHAVLALCKCMCVSSRFCQDNLQLLFTLLEKSDIKEIRSNVIIGLGDMAVCFNK